MPLMMLYQINPDTDAPLSAHEAPAVIRLIQEITGAGGQVANGGQHRRPKAAWRRISGKEFVVTDGPFTETKELIGG